MNKYLLLLTTSLAPVATVFAQGAPDAINITRPDMKGTARFMSMGGAFGALGGDLSSLSQNPAGIGVYRSGDIGFTLNLDCQNASATSQGVKSSVDQTKFLLNNIGAVLTMRLQNDMFPNINFGFTYNKAASFNRQYAGQVPTLNNSLSNYIAEIANGSGLQVADMEPSDSYDPWNSNTPWLPLLAYKGWLIESYGSGDNTYWEGQWVNGTSGSGSFNVTEKGSVDEYNIAVGGNIANVVYWGMDFGITNLDYTQFSRWGETLDNAHLSNGQEEYLGNAVWDLNNYYNVNGTGFNYKLGVILKPVQELRIGFAFHTPTWYNLRETYSGSIEYQYDNEKPDGVDTNDGTPGYNEVDFRTPWKVMASVAGVIGNNFILSFDYEWQGYNKMKYSEPGTYGGGGWGPDYWDPDWYPYYSAAPKTRAYPDASDPYYGVNDDINYYLKSTNTFRLGAEYRVTPSFSLRAGYSNVSSPVKADVRHDREIIYTGGTRPQYRFDNSTNYYTCGFGYRYQQFYIDMAYVYKHVNSTYHAYTPDVDYDNKVVYTSPQSKLSLNDSQIVLTAGFRF